MRAQHCVEEIYAILHLKTNNARQTRTAPPACSFANSSSSVCLETLCTIIPGACCSYWNTAHHQRVTARASLHLESRIFRLAMQSPRFHIPLTLGSSPTGPRNRRCKTQTNTPAHAHTRAKQTRTRTPAIACIHFEKQPLPRQSIIVRAFIFLEERKRQQQPQSPDLPHEIAHCHIVVLCDKT